MLRRRRVGALVAAVALAVVAAALPTAAYAADGSVTGRVITKSGTPAGAVCVRLSASRDWYSPVAASGTTAADGTYALSVAPGAYYVTFDDCGGRDLVTSFWPGVRDDGAAKTVAVPDGGTVSGVDATLEQGGSISGLVTDTAGRPQAGAFVYPMTPGNSRYPKGAYVRTDNEGRYHARGVPPGTYLVDFGPTAYHATVFYGDTPDAAQSPPVEVVAGQERAGVDARLPKVSSLSGVVRDEDGQPHERVCVRAVPSLDPRNRLPTVRTAADGSWRIGLLAAGSYRVEYHDCGGVTAGEWYGGAKSFAEATPVVLAEDTNRTGIDGVLGRGITISGTVRGPDGEPLDYAVAHVHDGITGWFTGRYAYTDANGRYTVPGVRGTLYTLRFTSHPDLVPRWWPGVRDKDDAVPISLVAGVSVTDADITLPRGGRMLGRVTGPAGDPAAACVSAVDAGYGDASGYGRTDADGRYVVTGLDTGSYHVRFHSCGPENHAPVYYGGTDVRETADPVSVAIGQDTTGIDGRLTAGATITGTVTDTAGRPVPRICVDGGATSQNTDADGRYVVTDLPASEHSRVSLRDCYTTPARYVPAALWVAVAAGGTAVADAVLVRGGSVSGTVVDQFGYPVHGICVAAIDGAGRHFSTHTDRSGIVSIGGVPPGRYVAQFRDCGAGIVAPVFHPGVPLQSMATELEVREGEDTPGIRAQVTVITTPKAPVDVRVSAGDRAATVSWQPPADTGNSPLTAFEVRNEAGAVVARTSGTARTATVTGLVNGTTYGLTVNAVNVKGPGDLSDRVWVAPRPPARLSVTAPATVVSGSQASISARLTDERGVALTATRLDLLGRRRGSTAAMTRLVSLTTGPTGAVRFLPGPTYPMEYAVRYNGSSRLGPVTVRRVVAASSRLEISVAGRSVYVVASPAGGGGRARLQVLRDTGWVSITGADLSATGRALLRAPTGGTYRVVVVRSGWATATGNRLRLA